MCPLCWRRLLQADRHRNKMPSNSEIKSSWNTILWILGSICIPISLPYLILNTLGAMAKKKNLEKLQGKVVVITGGSGGLGESLAHIFYKSGCKVVLAARRKEELERVRKDLLETHSTKPTHPPVIVPIDLSDLNSIPDKVQDILNIFGQIDILVNNGGISVRGEIMSTSTEVDLKVMLVNYFGSVAMTKAVLPHMVRRQSGHIVFVSSVQGKFAIPQRSAYTASKHAMQAFSDALRAEVDQHNIKVTVVSPGYINTALSMNALTGNGQSYGKMDVATAQGANPDTMARDILDAVLKQTKDIILAPIAPKIAYYLRYFCPSIYFWIMAKRARKMSTTKSS